VHVYVCMLVGVSACVVREADCSQGDSDFGADVHLITVVCRCLLLYFGCGFTARKCYNVIFDQFQAPSLVRRFGRRDTMGSVPYISTL